MNNNDKKKTLWKSNLEDFFHNYFIGISHLSCTEEDCPLVANWDNIEEKNSKKGLCAFYKITGDNFLVVDATVGNSTDLGTYENIEITLPSGAKRKTEPKESKPVNIQTSGVLPNKKVKEKEIFLKDNEFILFFNNQTHSPNLNGIDDYLEEMWDIKEKIRWDQKASKKKIINWVDQKPDPTDKGNKISEWEDNYIFYITDPDITSEIKTHEVYSTQNTKEREQLWVDYKEVLSELRRVNGIEHITSKKEERMNNPEVAANQVQFIALERRKKRLREQSIKECEIKKFCEGKHTLSYGSYQEHQQEILLDEIVESQEEENKSEQKETKKEPQTLILTKEK